MDTVYTDMWILFIQICGYCLYRYVDTVYTDMWILFIHICILYYRMTWTCVVLLLICLVPYNDGFFAELFDSLEDLPLRFVSGTCYFLLDKTYYPGEFEMFVLTDIPTMDLYVSS
jgi:hypothetical protein